MENKEKGQFEHVAEENKERERQQAIPPEEGKVSVFGHTPRIVSHSAADPIETPGDAMPEESEACRKPLEYGKNSGDAFNHTTEQTNPSGELVNNTGADPSGAGPDADAASG